VEKLTIFILRYVYDKRFYVCSAVLGAIFFKFSFVCFFEIVFVILGEHYNAEASLIGLIASAQRKDL